MSDKDMSDAERRQQRHKACLDEAGKGECPEQLFPWVMGYSERHEADFTAAYCRLGSVRIIVGYSAISGMGNSMTEWVVRNEVPAYCLAHIAARRSAPVGLHRIRTGREDSLALLQFKFPDRVPSICMRRPGQFDFYLGRAALLETDWYLNGYKVHRLCPDDPPEVVLRSPIRNKWDARSSALAIRDAQACYGLMTPGGEMADAEMLADELAGIAENLQQARGYPVNLAALYRHLESVKMKETGLNEPLRTTLAEAIAGYARGTVVRSIWDENEALRIRAAIVPKGGTEAQDSGSKKGA